MAKTIADLCPTEYGLLQVAPSGSSFDKTKRIKRWADPKALLSEEDMVVYKTFVKLDATGKPVWKNIYLTKPEAAAYNMPPAGQPVDSNSVSGGPECPIPARELREDEVIVNVPGPFGGVYQIVTASELEQKPITFEQSDRNNILAIKAKLGA